MRLQVLVVLSLFLSSLAGGSAAQAPSLKELQGAVTASRAKADKAREQLARTEARQTAAQIELRTMISGRADTHASEQAIKDLKKAEPDLTAIKARFLEESDRHDEKLADLKTKLAELQQEKVDTSDIDRQIAAAKDDLRQFDDYRARAVQELRQGYYCSQCSRPASQIVKETGKSFKQHLRDVRGRPIPMSESRIAKKQEEFDRKRASLERKLKSLQDKRDRQVKKQQDKVRKAQQAVNKEYDDYSARRTAFEADMAKARDKHRKETRARVDALEAKIKKTWDEHWDGIRKKQDEVSGRYDEMSRIRDQIHQHELDGIRGGHKVDAAIRHQRREMQQKAQDLAREKERLRRAARKAVLADLRARELRRLRNAQNARALRERRASDRFRQALARSRPDRTDRYDPPQQPVTSEPAATGAAGNRPSAPERTSAPVETAGLPASDAPTVYEPPAPQVPEPQAPEPQVQENWQAEEAERARQALARIERQEKELARAEQAQRRQAAELAEVEAERAETSRADRAAFASLIDEPDGNYFQQVAGWADDLKHAAGHVKAEIRESFSPEENWLRPTADTLLAFGSGGNGENENEAFSSDEPSAWDKARDLYKEGKAEIRNVIRAKISGAGETLYLGFFESDSPKVSVKVSDAMNSVWDSFKPSNVISGWVADKLFEKGYRTVHSQLSGQRFEDRDRVDQKFQMVPAAFLRGEGLYSKLIRIADSSWAVADEAIQAVSEDLDKLKWPYNDKL